MGGKEDKANPSQQCWEMPYQHSNPLAINELTSLHWSTPEQLFFPITRHLNVHLFHLFYIKGITAPSGKGYCYYLHTKQKTLKYIKVIFYIKFCCLLVLAPLNKKYRDKWNFYKLCSYANYLQQISPDTKSPSVLELECEQEWYLTLLILKITTF